MKVCKSAFLATSHVKRRQEPSPPARETLTARTLAPTNLPVGGFHGTVVTDVATGTTSPAGVYDPIMPSTETLLGMGLIVLLCAVVAWVWQNQVVPTARTNLAIAKSRGQVKDYLDELRATDPTKNSPTIGTAATAEELDGVTSINSTLPMTNETTRVAAVRRDDRALERWLFTDWLRDNKSERRAGRQKEPALPILREAKWNSGDNPVLAATLLIGLGVIFTAVTERIASFTI